MFIDDLDVNNPTCDFNCDSIVDGMDLFLMSGHWMTLSTYPTPTPVPCEKHFDLNRDGRIDNSDLVDFINDVKIGNLRSDFNCDGKVNWRDVFLLIDMPRE